MDVQLTPELEEIVERRLKSGGYKSANEVVEQALRLLQQVDEERAIYTAELQSRIDEGLASLDRGEGVDGEQFMQKMLDDLDAQNPGIAR